MITPIKSALSQVVPVNSDPTINKLDFIRRYLQHQFRAYPIPEANYPVRMIKSLAVNCLPEILKVTLDTLYKEKYIDKSGMPLVTSCVNTACSICTLLIGLKDTRHLMKCLNIESKVCFIFPKIPHLKVAIWDLFAGHVTQAINRDSELWNLPREERGQKIHKIALPVTQKFYDQINESVISGSTAEQIIEIMMMTSFNRPIIASLKVELKNNAKNVASDRSFIYCIKAKVPIIHQRHIQNIVQHVILLEQFFCNKTSSAKVRFYQSWIEQTTLLRELSKRSLDEDGQGAWDDEYLEKFLNNLEDYYCSDTGYLEPSKSLACFGYSGNFRQPLVCIYKGVITGINLRYIVREFNPKNCINHLQEVIGK